MTSAIFYFRDTPPPPTPPFIYMNIGCGWIRAEICHGCTPSAALDLAALLPGEQGVMNTHEIGIGAHGWPVLSAQEMAMRRHSARVAAEARRRKA